jgi:tetratricopeptide (TPR) repeat protein
LDAGRNSVSGLSSSAYLLFLSLAGLGAQPRPDLKEAARLDLAGRCEEAGKIYRQALAQGPPSAALLNNAGNHYLACGQPDKAREYFERLVQLAPEHVNGNLQLARLAMSGRRFADAERLLRKLAAARPADFDVLYLLGLASARAGNFARARETLEAALRLRPDDVGAMLECGLANAASGDFPRAVFLLARAQARAPDQPEIALALARASEDAGYYGDAVLAYDRYLALSPRDEPARRDRARALALTMTGREQGMRELEQYVARNPQDALGHFYLAQVRWSEDTADALARLAEAVRIDPRLAPAHVARAWLLHRLGRDTEALTHLDAALRVSPDDARALDQLGVVLLSLDRVAEAEAALRKAAALAPKDADVALHLGRALMDQGREQEAQHWLDTYQKLRPARKRDARRESGMIELATLDPAGRRAREIERFRSMARARPDDPLLQLHLAGLLLAGGQVSDALREYRTLSTLNGDAAIWAQAGRALLAAGEHEAARPFLERAGSYLDLAEAVLATEGPAAALAALDALPPAGRAAEYKLLRARVLEAAGRDEESARWLDEALDNGSPSAALAHQASLLLAKRGRYREALDLLGSAMKAAPADGQLRLTEAIVVALSGDQSTADKQLRQIQARWPDWDQPWFVHGLLLIDMRRNPEAPSRFRAAAALGSRDDPAFCTSLRAWVFDRCRK